MHRIVETSSEIEEIDTRINQMLDTAVDEALASPFPDPSTLMENVYGD
jgi:TPP-dependent pyruvate/acetoin dehydrogenase alpha subunit